MSMETALVAQLLADAGVRVAAGDRVHWLRRPQGGRLPAAVLHRIDGARDYHMTAASGLVVSRVQVDCWGVSYGAAKALARAVEAALSGRAFTRDAVRVDLITVESERDSTFDEPPETLFRTALDLMVHHAAAS